MWQIYMLPLVVAGVVVVEIVLLQYFLKNIHFRIPNNFLFYILIIGCIGTIGILSLPQKLIMDERVYYRLITYIMRNNGIFDPSVTMTMIPGYAYLMAGISSILHASSLSSLRTISFLLSIPALLVAYKISDHSYYRLVSLFLFPVIFPYFFIIYTDPVALLCVLLFFYLLKNKKTFFATLIGIFSFLIRQDTVIWLLFSTLWSLEKTTFKKNFKTLLPVLMTLFLLLIYLIWQGGVAFTAQDRLYHPLGIFLDNMIFFFFMHSLFFFPLHLRHWVTTIYAKNSNHYTLIGSFFFYAVLFFIIFKADHPFLFKAMLSYPKHQYLDIIRNNAVQRLLFATASAFSLAILPYIPMKKTQDKLILPFSVISSSLHWFIEVRYYIIPFAFFILRRKETPTRFEFLWQLFWTVVITFGLWNFRFYP